MPKFSIIIFIILSLFFVLNIVFQNSILPKLWYPYGFNTSLLAALDEIRDNKKTFLSDKNLSWWSKKYEIGSRTPADLTFNYSVNSQSTRRWLSSNSQSVKLKEGANKVSVSFIEDGNIHRYYTIPKKIQSFFIRIKFLEYSGDKSACKIHFSEFVVPCFSSKETVFPYNFTTRVVGFRSPISKNPDLMRISGSNSRFTFTDFEVFYLNDMREEVNLFHSRPEAFNILIQTINSSNSAVKEKIYFFESSPNNVYRKFSTALDLQYAKYLNVSFNVSPQTRLVIDNFSIISRKSELPTVRLGSIGDLPILMFGNKNLAGHSLAALSLCLLLGLVNNRKLLVAGFIFSAFIILPIGSRTAFVSFCAGFCLLFFSYISSKEVAKFYLFGLLGIITIFFVLDANDLIPRTKIWLAGLHVFYDDINGVGNVQESITREFGILYPNLASFQIDHAHNFWLQMAIRFGVFGFLGAFVLSVFIICCAWFFGKAKGIAFVAPLFLMNIFDYSLDYIGVWIPMLLGLGYLWYKGRLSRVIQKI